MKIKFTLLLMILIFAFSGFAMSNDTVEEPKIEKNDEVQTEQKSDTEFITQKELHNIAVNYYHYRYSEEHEWKGMKRKNDESIIRSILPFKADSLVLAYAVSFNPDGHIVLYAHKNMNSPIGSGGSAGRWSLGEENGYLSIYDKRLPPPVMSHYYGLKKKIENNTLEFNVEKRKSWQRFNIPPEEFHEKANFDSQIPSPKWWLEKKKASNQ